MKALTIIFWVAVGGVGVALAGTIVTAVKSHRPAANETPVSIPTPATAPAAPQGAPAQPLPSH